MVARNPLGIAEDMIHSRTGRSLAALEPARILYRHPTPPSGLGTGLNGPVNFPFHNSLYVDYAPAAANIIPLGISYYQLEAAELAVTVVDCGCMAVELHPTANFPTIGLPVYSSGVAGLATHTKGANTYYLGFTSSIVQNATKTPFPEGTRGLYPTDGQFYTPWPTAPGNIRGGADQYFILTAAQAANLGAAGVPTTGGIYNFLTNVTTADPNGILTAPEVAAQLVTPAGLVRYVGAAPFDGTLRYVLVDIMPGLAP